MSEAAQLWLFLGAFGLIGASFAWQWAHRQDCEAKRIANAEQLMGLERDVKYLLNEVGREHAEGMRARLHHLENRERAREGQ
jgi:hypothetical protein